MRDLAAMLYQIGFIGAPLAFYYTVYQTIMMGIFAGLPDRRQSRRRKAIIGGVVTLVGFVFVLIGAFLWTPPN
jgi:uncharacterized BrkB/YihY/UPF0761 family membrane protein